MFLVVKRATLLIPSGPASDPNKKHLFICLTDCYGADKETLIVSVSSYRAGLPADSTCKLFAGNHPFLKHESYVDYGNARIISAGKLMNGVKQDLFVPKEPLATDIFARVCFGVEQSLRTSTKNREFYLLASGRQ